jgi:hypothetical protein
MLNSTKWPDLLQAVVQRLDRGGSPDRHFPDRDGEYWALCPFHPDTHPDNFSVSEAGYHCFACGASGGLWALAEKLGILPPRDTSRAGQTAGKGGRLPPTPPLARKGHSAPLRGSSTGHPAEKPLAPETRPAGLSPTPRATTRHDPGGHPADTPLASETRPAGLRGCTVVGGGTPTPTTPTLENYAAAKRLPVEFLQSLGLSTVYPQGQPAVKIPYLDRDGTEIGARLRVALEGRNRFRWKKGTHVQPYGLWRLDHSRGAVILCEGESDAQTFWFHGAPALGVPGAGSWQAAWAEYVRDLKVYVWQEPDQGGETFSARVGASLPDCWILTPPQSRKDISECHIAGDDVPELVEKLRREARPWREVAADKLSQAAAEAKAAAAGLVEAPDILERFAASCRERGLVGEDRTAKLLFLAGVSRLLERPVSCVVKGASSCGKSVTVETVFEHFPPSAYYALSSMSEHSLAYSNESLVHRILILYEAAGMTSELASYFLRSLLSEGKIRYETVEKTRDGMEPKLIEREGPTGLILTTTGANLHPENETRMLSLTVRDDPYQTASVLRSLAQRANGASPDLPDVASWHALQTWLELAGRREVAIPYADELALQADSRAVRLRRDFGAVLNLIRAHAILHQGTRERDSQGRIVATLADYSAVYDLVIDIIGQGVQAMVSPTIRETVAAVKELDTPTDPGIQVTAIANALGIDKSAALRRVRVAIEDGYLVNLEERRGRPARITLGDPLPDERAVLPHPDVLPKEAGVGVVIPPPSTAQPCNRSTLATDGGGPVQSPPSSLHECTSPTREAADVGRIPDPPGPRAERPGRGGLGSGTGVGNSPYSEPDDRSELPPNPVKDAGNPSGGRPAEASSAYENQLAGLEPWQQGILDEYDACESEDKGENDNGHADTADEGQCSASRHVSRPAGRGRGRGGHLRRRAGRHALRRAG